MHLGLQVLLILVGSIELLAKFGLGAIEAGRAELPACAAALPGKPALRR